MSYHHHHRTKAFASTASTASTAARSPQPPFSNAGRAIIAISKMVRRSLFLKRTLATILVFLALYAFFNTFILSPFSPNSSPDDADPSLSSRTSFNLDEDGNHFPPDSKRVKVYMYDLPRKFTYGVIESYAMARGGLKRPVDDVSKLKYPGNQHPAEWYLFSDLMKDEKERIGSPVVRVTDPEEADLFYVPFFSSLSLVVNPIRPNGVGGNVEEKLYSDEKTQEDLIGWLEGQVYWNRNNGWDHVFICQDPNALYKVVDRIKNGVLLVSDFGRLRPDQASLVKDVILPYAHRINTFKGDVGVKMRKSLLFFMGNRYRKEGGKIRDTLFQILENERDVVMKHGAQSRESRRAATQVIVSDHIELPFEDIIDYRKIALFVDSTSALKQGFLIKLLRAVSTERILAYQQELKKVKHYFEYEDPDGTVNEIWRQVSLKLPLIKLMINRDNRLVKRDLSQPDCACLCSNQSGIITSL
ncbi:hypothetical protein Ancab_019187 [Ancistrocladus abbreviatus]